MRVIIALIAAVVGLHATASDDFGKNFADSTLRLDYIIGGNAASTRLMLQRASKRPQWAGRRHNLDRLPQAGSGTVTVTDAASGDTIYRHSFSNLYSEWLSTPEAQTTSRAFEATFLLPLPQRQARVTVDLYDGRNERMASNTHTYSPQDILVVGRKPLRPAPTHYLHKGADPARAIDIAILAEGYTPAEMAGFYADAQRAVDAIMSYEPYKSRPQDFNFVAVGTPSADSGVSVPREGGWKNTAFASGFDTFYSDRYLTSERLFDMHDAAAHVPYEHLIILANTDTYGGGGIYNNYMLAAAHNARSIPVIVHEFGHSFGGLGDEYFYEDDGMEESYPLDVEPREPNLTTLTDFKSKWADMLAPGTPVPTPAADAQQWPVGVYEGGGYRFHGVYRPADRCRMRDNDWPAFCPVCTRALNRVIDFYTR